jgi:hypothetical protein
MGSGMVHAPLRALSADRFARLLGSPFLAEFSIEGEHSHSAPEIQVRIQTWISRAERCVAG